MIVCFQTAVDIFAPLAVFLSVGAVKVSEVDEKTTAIVHMTLSHALNMLLWSDAQFFCRQHNGGTVSVISTDVKAIMAPRPLEPHPDVGLHLLQHVAQVQGSVGVGQRAGYQYFSGGVCSHSSKVSECIKTGRYYSGFDRRFHPLC